MRGSDRVSTSADAASASVAVVVIGRNEGARLVRCLDSITNENHLVIYVDSGSTDNSVREAQLRGAEVVQLDVSVPFTAARARNAGVTQVLSAQPVRKYIQFVDGDCEVAADWLESAVRFLEQNPGAAAVCGQRREQFPHKSIYNELCDLEWRKPAGQIEAFGGDVLVRVDALSGVGGYRDSLIAGEEPELSLRLRRAGWELYALDELMTHHDAGMSSFSQWWKRMKRSGYAYAAGAHLHGRDEEKHWVWQALQAWIWVPLPIVSTMFLATIVGGLGAVVLLVYPLQIFRLFLKLSGSIRERALLAISFTLVKFPEYWGQLHYLLDVMNGKRAEIIEYK